MRSITVQAGLVLCRGLLLCGVFYLAVQIFLKVPLLHWGKIRCSREVQIFTVGVRLHLSRCCAV